jgi:sterol 3beta-glucosyltransferase
MRITILAIGSRGDIQPLLALAVGLQQTNRHKVRFAAPDNFAPLVREHHLDFFPLHKSLRLALKPVVISFYGFCMYFN